MSLTCFKILENLNITTRFKKMNEMSYFRMLKLQKFGYLTAQYEIGELVLLT